MFATERHPYSTCPIEVWPTRDKGREGRMERMDAWGGREGVFVIERSLKIMRRGTRCMCDRKMPREKSR